MFGLCACGGSGGDNDNVNPPSKDDSPSGDSVVDKPDGDKPDGDKKPDDGKKPGKDETGNDVVTDDSEILRDKDGKELPKDFGMGSASGWERGGTGAIKDEDAKDGGILEESIYAVDWLNLPREFDTGRGKDEKTSIVDVAGQKIEDGETVDASKAMFGDEYVLKRKPLKLESAIGDLEKGKLDRLVFPYANGYSEFFVERVLKAPGQKGDDMSEVPQDYDLNVRTGYVRMYPTSPARFESLKKFMDNSEVRYTLNAFGPSLEEGKGFSDTGHYQGDMVFNLNKMKSSGLISLSDGSKDSKDAPKFSYRIFKSDGDKTVKAHERISGIGKIVLEESDIIEKDGTIGVFGGGIKIPGAKFTNMDPKNLKYDIKFVGPLGTFIGGSINYDGANLYSLLGQYYYLSIESPEMPGAVPPENNAAKSGFDVSKIVYKLGDKEAKADSSYLNLLALGAWNSKLDKEEDRAIAWRTDGHAVEGEGQTRIYGDDLANVTVMNFTKAPMEKEGKEFAKGWSSANNFDYEVATLYIARLQKAVSKREDKTIGYEGKAFFSAMNDAGDGTKIVKGDLVYTLSIKGDKFEGEGSVKIDSPLVFAISAKDGEKKLETKGIENPKELVMAKSEIDIKSFKNKMKPVFKGDVHYAKDDDGKLKYELGVWRVRCRPHSGQVHLRGKQGCCLQRGSPAWPQEGWRWGQEVQVTTFRYSLGISLATNRDSQDLKSEVFNFPILKR